MKMKRLKLLRVFVIAFVVAMALGTTTTAFAAVRITDGWGNYKMPQIQRGSYGDTVSGCQSFLSLEGYNYYLGSYGIDGDFGAATYDAVRAYQYVNRASLVVDGIVGPGTWTEMRGDITYWLTTSTEYYYKATTLNNNDFTHPYAGSGIDSWWANIGGDMVKMCN